jgi:hypothetical protein
MSWALLNLPLAGLIFLAVAGIPLWIVIRHPDAGPRPAAGLAAQAGRLAVAARPWCRRRARVSAAVPASGAAW